MLLNEKKEGKKEERKEGKEKGKKGEQGKNKFLFKIVMAWPALVSL